jgi:hypothetical protein
MRDTELKGKRVKLKFMEDGWTDLRPGDMGTIRGVDDLGHILVRWDNGSSLSLIEGVDEWEIIEESKRVQNFSKFVNENYSNPDMGYIESKLAELEELVKSFSEEKNLRYRTRNKRGNLIIISFALGDYKVEYEYTIKGGTIVKTLDGEVEFEKNVDSVDEGLEVLEEDIKKSLSITEKKSNKVPSKYLTGNHPKKMKKEIEKFKGTDNYKKDWDADYKSGKGGVGKRETTKKSDATKAYHKKFN